MRHEHHSGACGRSPFSSHHHHHHHREGSGSYGHEGRGGHHGRHRGSRVFDYGELRLLILSMLAERPRHGYELIKDIEERLGGAYSPSPGVIYPTLSWLEDAGWAIIESQEGGRKRYGATDDGRAHLAANTKAVEDITGRLSTAGEGRGEGVPAPVLRAVENLKLALRLRFRAGPVDQAQAEALAAAIDAAAQAVERS